MTEIAHTLFLFNCVLDSLNDLNLTWRRIK